MNILLYISLTSIVIGIMYGIVKEQWSHANKVTTLRELKRMKGVNSFEYKPNRFEDTGKIK